MNHILPAMLCLGMLLVGVGSAHAQVSANVTSDTANGTYTKGSIDVRMMFSENIFVGGFNIVDGKHGFDELNYAYSITTTQIDGNHYALVAAYNDDGVQIIDITDPANPVSTANITDDEGGFGELDGAHSVTTTQIDGNHYALVAAYNDDGVQIIDITDPANPVSTANITDDEGGFGELGEARSVTTTQIDGNHYALVAAYNDDGVQIIDITDPANPVSTANITDGEGGFGELSRAYSVTTTQIDGKHYALVASDFDDGVQIIDISDPANPVSTANITDGEGGFGVLLGARSVTTTQIDGNHYALVAAYNDHGVQIIDITDPANPVSTANITDGEGGFGELYGAHSVTTTQIDGNHYALVASDFDDGVQIIDITDPANPVSTANITDGEGGFGELIGAYSVTTTQIGGNHYALVASFLSGVQIIDITNPAYPINPLLPFITLDTAPPARAVYKESESQTMIFEYDVREYDYSPRLAYDGMDAFHVNSYTLTYSNGTSIPTVLLPEPGSMGSLSYNKAIQIGLTPPNHIDPVIHNTGPVTVSQNAIFVSSVTCTDDVDASPDLTHPTVDTSNIGQQTVTYTCTDTSKNAVTATQSVTVTPDRTLPTIVIPGDNPLTITEGDVYTAPVATCTDDVDASPTLTPSGTVNSTTPSTYTVTYTCTDNSNNTATAILKVIVKIDVAPYVVSIETGALNTITMIMSEAVQDVTTTTGFTISGIASNPSIDSATSTDSTITLTLSANMLDSDSPRLVYDDTTGSITDLKGKPLAGFDESVRNTLDTTAPTVRSVTIDNSGTVYVRLSEVVFEDPVNGPDVFTTSNSSITVSPAVVSGSTITMTLDPIPDDEVLTLIYTRSAGKIADAKGNFLASFDDEPINKQSRKRSSSSTSAPAVDLASLQSLGYMDSSNITNPHDPLAPITPMNAGDSSNFAIAINDSHYLLGGSLNTLEPQTLLTGVPNTISFAVYDHAEIAHFTLYMNLHGQNTEYRDSDTYVTYDMGNIRIVDPHDLIADATVSIKTSEADSVRHIVVFSITFEDEMEQTNLVVRTWNTNASFTMVRILNAFEVVTPVSEAVTEPESAVDPEPVTVPGVDPKSVEDSVIGLGSTTADKNTPETIIRMWSGFAPESATDRELLAVLDLEPDGNLPDWTMTHLGTLFSKGQISLDEFVTAISYVLENS